MKLKLFCGVLLHNLCVSAQNPIWLTEPTLTYHEVRLCANQRVWLKVAPDSDWALAADDGRVLKTGFETQFDYVSDFDQLLYGRAIVHKKNGDWCIINENADIQRVIKWQGLKITGALPISEGFIPVRVKENKMESWTFMDTTGSIWRERFDEISPFSGGIAAVKQNSSWKFIDKFKKVVFSHKYDDTNGFSEHLAAVTSMQEQGKWGFINEKGIKKVDFKYDYAFAFSNRRAIILQGDKYGAIYPDGRLAIPTHHTKMESFSQDLTAAKTEKGWGFLDTLGRVVLPQQWEAATSFKNGKAWVKSAGKWGILRHPFQQIEWLLPTDTLTYVQQSRFKIQLFIGDTSNMARIDILINGQLKSRQMIKASNRNLSVEEETDLISNHSFYQKELDLNAGENNIVIEVYSKTGAKQTASRRIIWEKRLALVIGNSQYLHLASNRNYLPNAVNDVDSMSKTLKELNFEVMAFKNQGKMDMYKVMQQFAARLRNYEVGLFYYAGHGVEVDGINYAVPTDMPQKPQEVIKDCISMDTLRQMMSDAGVRKTNIVLFDACREELRGKTTKKPKSFKGFFTAFAVSRSQLASDGLGKNGLYTSVLLKHIKTKGIPIEEVFQNVRKELDNLTTESLSEEHTTLIDKFYFKK